MNSERILSIVQQGAIYLIPDKVLDESTCTTEEDETESDIELERVTWIPDKANGSVVKEEKSADVTKIDLTGQQLSICAIYWMWGAIQFNKTNKGRDSG